MKYSTYIFEGEIISSNNYKIKTGKYTFANFTSHLVEVREVIKGDIQKGTIEIVQNADGIIEERDGVRTHAQSSHKFTIPRQAIYFCFDIEERMKNSNVSTTNSKSVQILDAVPLYNNEVRKNSMGGIDQYFNSRKELYNYLNTYYSLKIDPSILAQTPFDPFKEVRPILNPGDLINQSTLIIEGKTIDTKKILKRTSTTEDAGEMYSLIIIKPTASLKGQCDSSKRYQFLIYRGEYNYGGSLISPNHNPVSIPENGIFFIDEKATSPDYIKPFEKASFVNFNFAIDFNTYKNEKTYQYLLDSYKLKPIVFDNTDQKKRDQIVARKSVEDSTKQAENKRLYEIRKKNQNGIWQND